MMKKNKLIRDKIPEIIKSSGRTPLFHIADNEEYGKKLYKKLKEETNEFLMTNDASELVDILEVMYAIATRMGLSIEQVEHLRIEKARKNGAFQNKVILDAIEK